MSERQWILTAGGRPYYFGGDDNKYSIKDFAAPLSRICRFGGHVKAFYSVAQHSVLCAQNVPEEFRFEALMHDAHEAFVGDMPKPLKMILPDYEKAENLARADLCSKFALPVAMSPEVKTVDERMLVTEMRDLMMEYPGNYSRQFREPFEFKIEPMEPAQAYAAFIEVFVSIAR